MNILVTFFTFLSLLIWNTDSGSDQQAKISPGKVAVDDYLEIKDALAADNSRDAAKVAKQLVDALKNLNKTVLSEEQKKVLGEIEDDALENASHIGENPGNIQHQREHFVRLSLDIYDLVKSSGAGRVLYKISDKNYNNGKGAFWLSETKEINNPYLGKADLKRGSIQEEIE
jgi:hypothetical protein